MSLDLAPAPVASGEHLSFNPDELTPTTLPKPAATSVKKPAKRAASKVHRAPRPRTGDPRAEARRARKRHRQALGAYVSGCIIGGIIPSITWDVAHHQAPENPWLYIGVLGGLVYSAPLVADWFSQYVGKWKGYGFVVALETALTVTNGWTDITALVVLSALNAYVLGGILRRRVHNAVAVEP